MRRGIDRRFLNVAGDVPRVDGQLAVARAFGDKSLKIHLSSEPDITHQTIDDETEFIVFASDGIWKVFREHFHIIIRVMESKFDFTMSIVSTGVVEPRSGGCDQNHKRSTSGSEGVDRRSSL